jgi:hypothetical protein
MRELVVDPEAAPAEQHEFLVAKAAQNSFVDDFAGVIVVDHVLRLADGEFCEAIHRHIGKELENVRTAKTAFPQE